MNHYASRIASAFVGNDDISQAEGEKLAAEIIKPLVSDQVVSAQNAASEKHHAQMMQLAEFVGADIAYCDRGNGEDYVLRKHGRSLTLQIRGNRADGAFLCISSD